MSNGIMFVLGTIFGVIIVVIALLLIAAGYNAGQKNEEEK